MNTIQPGVSQRRLEEPAKLSQGDVLRCLEQSAILLDHVLDRAKRGGGGLPAHEQRALAGNLSIVTSVLSFLRQNVVPSLLAEEPAGGTLRQQAAREVLARLEGLTAELERCFTAPPGTLN